MATIDATRLDKLPQNPWTIIVSTRYLTREQTKHNDMP